MSTCKLVRSLVLAFDVTSCLHLLEVSSFQLKTDLVDASVELADLFINNVAKPSYVKASAYLLARHLEWQKVILPKSCKKTGLLLYVQFLNGFRDRNSLLSPVGVTQ